MLQWRCCLDCCYQKSPVWGTPVWVEAWVVRGLRYLVRFTVWSPREWSWWKTDIWKSSLWTQPWKPGQSQLGSWRGWELRADLCLYQMSVSSDFGKSCFGGEVRRKSLINSEERLGGKDIKAVRTYMSVGFCCEGESRRLVALNSCSDCAFVLCASLHLSWI